MRKIYLFAAIAFLASCNPRTDKSKTEAEKAPDPGQAKQESMTYPFTPDYSADFEIGDTKNAQTILNLYQNWDNNTLDNSKSSFAETDTMYFSDGTMFAGPTNANFGRIITKSGDRRDIQLALRYMF